MLKESVAFGTSCACRFCECMTDSQSLLYSGALGSTLMELGIRRVWWGHIGGWGTLCLSLLISASVAPDVRWSRSWGFVFVPTTCDMAVGWKRGCNVVFQTHGRWISLFIITEGHKWQSGREGTLICSQHSACLTRPMSNMITSSFSLLSVSL